MNSRDSEHVGKVFIATRGMRRCLICESLFMRKDAAEHAGVPCFPKTLPKSEKREEQ
jgi:hypothetical protein